MTKKLLLVAAALIFLALVMLAYRHYSSVKDTADLTPEQYQKKHAE